MSTPLVKWLGGKRQLLDSLLKKIPKYDCYFEPFFGGGALFFSINPARAVINDQNDQLMNLYVQIKDAPESVMKLTESLQGRYNSESTDDSRTQTYYAIRKEFNQHIANKDYSADAAAHLLFLNKAGFNGIYRVNSQGRYNVPSAHRKYISAFEVENVMAVSESLKKCEILHGDFESACNKAKAGDFVFFDSPYYETFDSYRAGGFNTEDHIRLFKLFEALTKKNVSCLLTNSNTDFIKDMYKSYRIKTIGVKRFVNRDGSNRTGSEVIITNY